MRPDLQFVEFRGNVQTRFKKLDAGVAEATFLACAGLNRLGTPELANPIAPEVMLPAVAQGAVSIEQRAHDDAVSAMLAPLNDPDTQDMVEVERAFLKELDGSCRTPLGGLAFPSGDAVHFRGEILSPDGGIVHRCDVRPSRSDAPAVAAEEGKRLKALAGPGFFG
jgi:hydroxymethylbilane synthase